MKTFDKNNWYIEEKNLTDEQYRKVCQYLVDNHRNWEEGFERIERVAGGTPKKYYDDVGFFDVTGVVDGKYSVDDLDLPVDEFKDCTKITYEEFEEYLLEGWIDWQGGECPVEPDVHVDVMFSHSFHRFHNFFAGDLRWLHLDDGSDIVKYRLHKPSKSCSEPSNTDAPVSTEKPLESISERLVSIQKELLDIIKDVGCDIAIYNDQIAIDLGEDFYDKEFTWCGGRHSVEDLQKLLDGVKMIKEFEDK